MRTKKNYFKVYFKIYFKIYKYFPTNPKYLGILLDIKETVYYSNNKKNQFLHEHILSFLKFLTSGKFGKNGLE